MRLPTRSHAFFAVTMLGIGVIGIATGHFTPTWSGVPKAIPLRGALAYLCAAISLVAGAGLLWPRTALAASRLLVGWLGLWLVVVRLPHLALEPRVLDSWWGTGDTAVMLAAAWVLRAWGAGERGDMAESNSRFRVATVLYGLAMIPFGVAHLINLGDTASLVPPWLPWHVGWATATGCAFLAAGLAILTGVAARLAATLSAWQMAAFTLLVWVPVVIAGPNAFQWNEFVDSWTLTAGAWVVAESYRGAPWLALVRLRPRTLPSMAR